MNRRQRDRFVALKNERHRRGRTRKTTRGGKERRSAMDVVIERGDEPSSEEEIQGGIVGTTLRQITGTLWLPKARLGGKEHLTKRKDNVNVSSSMAGCADGNEKWEDIGRILKIQRHISQHL